MSKLMRSIICMLCAILLLISLAPPAVHAAAGSTSTSSQGVIGKQMQQYYEDEDNKPGLMERTIAEPIISVSNFILKFFGTKDVVTLVFGIDPSVEGEAIDARDGFYLGVFTEGMMNAIDALYGSFERFMPFPVILAVLLIALLLLFQGMSADGRSKAKDYMLAFLIGLLSIRFGHYIWSFVAYVTQKFTTLIWATMLDHGIKPDLFLSMIWGSGTDGYNEMVKYRGFVVALLVLLAAIMTAVLNYQYTMRTINLMVLVSTFVIAAILTIFPKYRQALQTWWNEFVSQMLLPCAHALALGLFFLLLHFGSEDVSNWVIVAYLFGFSAIQALVFRLLGSEDQSGMGKAMGFGTMLALSRMFNPQKPKKGAGTSGKGGSNETDESSGGTVSAEKNEGGMQGVTAPKQRSWRQNAVRMGSKAAGYALSYGGKAAGAVAGTSIGMMAGNPMYGALIGTKLGGAVGKGAEMVGKGGVWAGQKAASGIGQLIEARRTRTDAEVEESPAAGSTAQATRVAVKRPSTLKSGKVPSSKINPALVKSRVPCRNDKDSYPSSRPSSVAAEQRNRPEALSGTATQPVTERPNRHYNYDL